MAPKVDRREKQDPRSQALPRLQPVRQSILKVFGRIPKATGNRLERVSASFFEARSQPPRQRLYSLPEAPETLVSLGESEEGEASIDVRRNSAVEAERRRTSSAPTNLRAIYGLHPQQEDSQRFSTSLTEGAVRSACEPYTVEAQVRSSDEARELRIWPSPSTPTRVLFTRGTQVTYETIQPPPRAASQRPQKPFTPSWRG